MGKRDDVLATVTKMILLAMSHLGWKHYPEAMAKGQKQAIQALMLREVNRGTVYCVRCSDYPGWGNSREYAYTIRGRRIPKAKGGHLLSVNEVLVCIEMFKHIPDFPWKIIEIVPEYSFSYLDGKFVSNTAEELPDGTVIIPDIRVRFLTEEDEQVIWFVEVDNGTEPILYPKKGYSFDGKNITESDGKHIHDPSSLGFKFLNYREYINGLVWEKYNPDGKVVAVQNLYVLNSSIRAERLREAVISLAEKQQNFVWILNKGDLDTPFDFWSGKVWNKSVNEPEPFSILNDGMIEIDRFNI
ncbi:hypothetical protein GF312_10820 [Candidatus Poribacteria bacterium]|nr:hypothetical protein [Candidatus Poribacteria bacterium]